MNNNIKAQMLAHIDSVLTMCAEAIVIVQTKGQDDLRSETIVRCITSAFAVIDRIVGDNNSYKEQAILLREKLGPSNSYLIAFLTGVVQSLRDAIEGDYLISVRELVHSDMFSDFLEMADHFQKDGFKDAAAVIGGGVLENQLRQLLVKNGIDTEVSNGTKSEPKNADRMNNEIAGIKVYGKLEQKSITAWLDLRNSAAHARYDDYDHKQVANMLQGIRDFVIKFPA